MFTDFYKAWWFLNEHPAFGNTEYRDEPAYNLFSSCLSVEVVKVYPSIERIERAESLNTATRVWLECGPTEVYEGKVIPTHDMALDCGAPTFEEAIIKLANLVQKQYVED